MSKTIDIEALRIKKALDEQTNLGLSLDEVSQGLAEAHERHQMYDQHDAFTEKYLLARHNIQPMECHNSPCEQNTNGQECNGELGRPVACMFRMTQLPPNSLNYGEYMPSHQEALDRLQKHKLLKGDDYDRDNPSYGKPKTQEARLNTEVKGITFYALSKCIEEALKDLPADYHIHDDAEIISRNASNLVEREMGIWPNIVGLR